MNFPWHEYALAALTGLGLTLVGMPVYLNWAKGHGWGQFIRQEGPQSHLSKAGTPTMGGLFLLLAGLIGGFWAETSSWELWLLRFVIVSCAILGAVDDLNKVLHHQNLGLRARDKLLIQVALGLLLGGWVCFTRENLGVSLPVIGFVGGAWLVWAVSLFLTVGTINAVNLTDGLDGLASLTSAAALLAYSFILSASGLPELGVTAVGLVGACLGFLWYNAYPAKVFMGDTGSLGLGGALAVMALLTGTEALLVLIGGVFVMETASVIIQVAYFKLTGGKRVFRMTPIHHHFELGGLHEVQVTSRFVLMGVVFAILGTMIFFGVL